MGKGSRGLSDLVSLPLNWVTLRIENMLVKEPPAGSVCCQEVPPFVLKLTDFVCLTPVPLLGAVFPLTCAMLWRSKQTLTSAPVAASSSVTIPCPALQKPSVSLVSLGPVLAGLCLESAWAI